VRILVFNCGSSSLKFELISLTARPTGLDSTRLVKGNVANIGRAGGIKTSFSAGARAPAPDGVKDHASAVQWLIDWLRGSEWLKGALPDAIGHRVVHGGPRLFDPVLVDDAVVREIAAVSELAPLHNHAALEAINAARVVFGDAVPMVAVFDTGFHHDMPEHASRYAIPPAIADEHGIRRYGFHGIAHRYMAGRCAELLGRPLRDLRLVTLQLGSGCSAAAVRGGKSVDTSMGFTPLEGLVMGTRCGDIDAAVVSHLCDRAAMTTEEVDDFLNHRSGLLGVSGMSADVRELLALERQDHRGAALATGMFCYRLRKYIGAYMAALGGADAVTFGGGIGENCPEVRARACGEMDWCGLRVDESRNREVVGVEGEVSAAASRIRVFVIPVDEEIVIAGDTFECLTTRKQV
jgi:acetate kinase